MGGCESVCGACRAGVPYFEGNCLDVFRNQHATYTCVYPSFLLSMAFHAVLNVLSLHTTPDLINACSVPPSLPSHVDSVFSISASKGQGREVGVNCFKQAKEAGQESP